MLEGGMLVRLLCVAIITIIKGVHCNLEGMHLRVAAEHWDPFFIIPEGEGASVAYSGLMEKVLNYLRLSLNFSTNVMRPPDRSWGVLDEEVGRWGGMIGMVHRNEGDFAVGKSIYIYMHIV